MNFSTMLGRPLKGNMDPLGRITGIIIFDRVRSTAQGIIYCRRKKYTVNGVYRAYSQIGSFYRYFDYNWYLDLVPLAGPLITLAVWPVEHAKKYVGFYDSVDGSRGDVEFTLE